MSRNQSTVDATETPVTEIIRSIADPVLTTEAARIIEVSVETIRTWERQGILPAVKTERGVRVFSRQNCIRLARQRRTARKKARTPRGQHERDDPTRPAA
jgi:hypothetical protein